MSELIEEEILPQALMFGVSYNEFWDMTPNELKPFIKAFSLRQEMIDTNMWVLGSYVRAAIVSCFNKQAKYPAKPITSQPKEITTEMIKEKFLQRAEQLNSRFRRD